MLLYVARRSLQALLFTFIASLVVYTILVYLMHDGPAKMKQGLLNGNFLPRDYMKPEEIDTIFKLDKPWPLSFFLYLFDPGATTEFYHDTTVPTGLDISIGDLRIQGSGLLTGNFGRSDPRVHTRGSDVRTLLSQRWANTALLTGISLLLTILIAIPLGVIQAVRRHTVLDHSVSFLSFASLSAPAYVLGLVLVICLAVFPKLLHDQPGWSWLPYLPPGNTYTPDAPSAFWDRVYHLVLPVVTLVVPQVAVLSRYMKFSMLEVLGDDYVRTALALGVSRRRIVMKYAFKNALLPVITTISLVIPALASGAIVVETVFAYAGMGQLYFQAMGGCVITSALLVDPEKPPCPPLSPIDYPTAIVMTMMLILVTALSSVLADYLYTAADPRVAHANAGAA